MGLAYANIRLRNPRLPDLQPMEARALADSGAITIGLPHHIALQLQLEEVEKREVTFANGQRQLVPYAGPVQITFGNRNCFTGAFVCGTQVMLGAVPMEDMDLVINPLRQEVTVNPDSPNFASGVVMGVRYC
jgi:clan AA aspartic protease